MSPGWAGTGWAPEALLPGYMYSLDMQRADGGPLTDISLRAPFFVYAATLAVAGTTFSITMAVLALTSSSYGPRLIRNFMADRGNQVVLGVYVATFLYSLLVLRSVRAIGDPGDPEAEVDRLLDQLVR